MEDTPRKPVAMTVTIKVIPEVLAKFEWMASISREKVEQVLGNYATDCLLDYGKHVYDAQASETMTEEDIEDAIFGLELELELRKRMADEEVSEASRLDPSGPGLGGELGGRDQVGLN